MVMDSAKLNLQTSDFSPLVAMANSQMLASSHSLSIPSEPPDLGKWFPSYQYESPVLNSNSFLDESVMHESRKEEKEKLSGGFSQNGRKDEAFVCKKQNSNGVVKCGSFSRNEHESRCLSENTDCLESGSLISEPTNIRNWFSSYQYESPPLDTTDGFEDSVCKESKHEKDGFLVDTSNKEKENDLRDFCTNRSDTEDVVGEKVKSEGFAKCNIISRRDNEQERQLVSETARPLESPSLLSEPTDIRNWFSSYAYESPSLDTTDAFGDSVWKEINSGKDGFVVENSTKEKEGDLDGFSEKRTDGDEAADLQLEGLPKCISFWREKTQERQTLSEGHSSGVNENLPSQNDLCLYHMPKSLQNHVMAPAKDVEISILNKESSECNGTKINPSNNKRSSCSDDEKSPQYMTRSKDFNLEENAEAKFHTSEGRPTNGTKTRKDDGKEISENGFITTRKGKHTRKNYENIGEGPQEICKVKAPLAIGRDAVVKRKALADATNFHHSPVMEITGKWKCPQRSKPNLGPSLRQLRLEKWVRRL